MNAIEEDAASLLGAQIQAFGYLDGCIVLRLTDGRKVRFGSDDGELWFAIDETEVLH